MLSDPHKAILLACHYRKCKHDTNWHSASIADLTGMRVPHFHIMALQLVSTNLLISRKRQYSHQGNRWPAASTIVEYKLTAEGTSRVVLMLDIIDRRQRGANK